MANPEELCPTCHSKISQSGVRVKDGESDGIPVWSGDPILTPDQLPLNGTDYRGTQFITERDILELQADRVAWESALGITPPTEFSDVSLIGTQGLEAHIVELRMSTERILEELDSNLSEYFSTDADGDVQPPGPNDVAKDEWTDVVRGAGFQTMGLNSSLVTLDGTQFIVSEDAGLRPTPCLPNGTYIRGIHIEDLRHPFEGLVEEDAWVEVFSPAVPVSVVSPPASQLTITGDVHQYNLVTSTTLPPLPAIPAEASITVTPNTLFDGESNFLDYNLRGGYAAPGGFRQVRTGQARIDGIASPAFVSPIPVTANTQLEIYFDYTFMGGTVPIGADPLTGGPFFTMLVQFISPPVNPSNRVTISLIFDILRVNDASPYLYRMRTVVDKSGDGMPALENFAADFTTLSEPGDAFDGLQAVIIPFAPFVNMFNFAASHSFRLLIAEARLLPLGRLTTGLSTTGGDDVRATVTFNGYRIREV